MKNIDIQNVIEFSSVSDKLKIIGKKIIDGVRINREEGLLLYNEAGLGFLGLLANFVREKQNGNNTYFNKNFHIEPTNICVYNCKFCSYSRKKGEKGSWELSIDEILEKVRDENKAGATEIHIVGGVHPDRDIDYYGDLIFRIKQIRPDIHVKAFTAVEIDCMIKNSGLSLKEGLLKLKEYGLDSMPGGGAEIFDKEVRNQICGEKSSSKLWLKIHEAAHEVGIPSNATMLYGHMEEYKHRVDHLDQLRSLQDNSGGFNAFIPLKYRSKDNEISHLGEVNMVEDLKNYAISRIYLDNIAHIKAYWPMIGKEVAQLSLSFGVDDMDGTIDDTTKIYSMAGAEDQKPSISTDEIVKLIKDVNRVPVERDSLYNVKKMF